jgi:hypothetical protein
VSNPFVTRGRSFVEVFWFRSDAVFEYDFLSHEGCRRRRIYVSPVEAVLLMISESAATEFSVVIFEPTRAVGAVESSRQP